MEVLNEQYFDRIYEDFSREHVKLLQNMRTGTDDKATQKQIVMLASLQMSILKLRNFRKVVAEKRD